MANVLAPFGFRHCGYLPGYAPDYQLQSRPIAAGNATKIFFGDPVVGLSTGYIAQSPSTPSGGGGTGTIVIGIFQGCQLVDTTGLTRFLPAWPGAALLDAEGSFIAAPGALFLVQVDTGPVVLADIGSTISFNIGTGSTVGQQLSGATLNYASRSNSAGTALPFRIVSLYGGPAGVATGLLNAGGMGALGNGADNTTANNWCVVTFNTQEFRAGVPGV